MRSFVEWLKEEEKILIERIARDKSTKVSHTVKRKKNIVEEREKSFYVLFALSSSKRPRNLHLIKN